ncbi:MAG: FAD-dependent thymidylate synthase, partial [Oscillospiraceae bacterium]|nr:FAD-dependent thymidylate synthase [Oscillospiraceae bacterium]
AFNNVSVFVEQFMIEFRLASFTVKSRRYVDFAGAGYYVSDEMDEKLREEYSENMEGLFKAYAELIELGIPKEDARFILPYCFYSNFIFSCNARELEHVICSMLYGRGSAYPEIKALGMELKEQFDEFFPGIVESDKDNYSCPCLSVEGHAAKPHQVSWQVELVSTASEWEKLMAGAGDASDISAAALTQRARALELVNFVYRIDNISLATLTHLVRHRMQGIVIPELILAAMKGAYMVPDTVRQLPAAMEIYASAFERNSECLNRLLDKSLPAWAVPYFSMSGNTLDVFSNMNCRELRHFVSLRTCNRAQWEIRQIAFEMLRLAKGRCPELVKGFGPGCYMTGRCPEGKMSCGKAAEVREYIENL